MNLAAIAHQSDSRFSYALGGNAARFILRSAKGDPDLTKVEILYNTWTQFYQKQIAVAMKRITSDDLYDYYAFELDEGKPDYVYVFRLTDSKGKALYFSESGFTDSYDFKHCFLNEFFFAYPNPADVIEDNPAFQGRLFYQIFPERFASSDLSKEYINQPWDSPTVRNDRYSGGDFKGITARLPYLASLGIGAIYLNPIHPADSAHMYDVEDYFGINPKLGNEGDFKLLVAEAHRLDIKIVMDLVFNHTSNRNPMFLDVAKKGKASPFYSFYFIAGDTLDLQKRNYLSFCDVPTMPRLNTSNPEVQEYLCSVGEYWLKTFGVDGYRLDVAFDVSHAFWRLFKSRLIKISPSVILIGEDWLNSESHLSKGEWDSVMNYPFRLALMEEKEGEKGASWLADRLNGLLMRYTENTNRMMLNLLSSHDVERWRSLLKNDLDYYYQSYALLMFYPGWPCLYYGDEILMEGGNDPDNRRNMIWKDEAFESEGAKRMKAILALRKEETLKKGDWSIVSDSGLLLVRRSYKKKSLTLALNLSKKFVNFALNDAKMVLDYRADKSGVEPGGFIVAEKENKQ
jgi:cyclomaltodextrinase / maltogenic alpha-amylase / neopullulanase